MAGVEGFEPPHDGTRTRCLTTWRHPIAVDTVAQAGVVFKLFALELIGFVVLHTCFSLRTLFETYTNTIKTNRSPNLGTRNESTNRDIHFSLYWQECEEGI